MEAVRYHEHGDPDVLSVEEVERPEPGHGEVLVAVEAAAINPVDTYFREGSFPPGDLPWIPGCDCAGRVEAVGPGVTEYEVDDPVFATGLGAGRPGTCAEYVAVPTDMLARRPDALDADEGAALALVGATAWQGLIAAPDLTPADVAMIQGASGGVGHVAVQLAVAAGATVTATASPPNHDRVRDLGATTVIDYGRADLADAIVDAGRPDLILDHRFDEYVTLDREIAAQGAEVVTIGNESLTATIEDIPQWRITDLTNHHVSVFNAPDVGAVLERLGALAERGDVRPIIARRYDLEDVPEAHRAVGEDSYFGKLVVNVA